MSAYPYDNKGFKDNEPSRQILISFRCYMCFGVMALLSQSITKVNQTKNQL